MAATPKREPGAAPLKALAVVPLGGAEIPASLTRALGASAFTIAVKPPLEEVVAASAIVFVGRDALVADAVAGVRAGAKTALVPVLAIVDPSPASAWIDRAWRSACDAALDSDAEGSVLTAAIEKLARICAAVAQLPDDDIGRGESEKRRIRALRWIATREIEKLAPAKSALSTRLHRWGALDAICGEHVESDLAALERASFLRKEFADRVYVCGCGDARLVFRDACAKCRSTRVEMRALIRHRCGHAGPSGDFWKGEELVCPACHAALVKSGDDYEGPHEEPRCEVCATFSKDGITIATCLGCGETADAAKLAAIAIDSFALTEQGRVALLAVPGDPSSGDRERRLALIAAWKKLASPPPPGRKPPIASLVRYTAVSASGAELDALIDRTLRGGDHAVRVGGNSFVALLAETTRDGARRFVERIAVAERGLAAGVLPLLPATQVHCWPEDGAAFEAAIRPLEP